MGRGAQFVGTERSYLKRDETPKLLAASWIQLDVARELWAWWAGPGQDVPARADEGLQAAAIAGSPEGPRASQLRPFVSRNVLAMLQGTMPFLAKRRCSTRRTTTIWELIRLCGRQNLQRRRRQCDSCGILLELARVWAAMPVAAPRSILFASVTAEEQGLLGSEYLGNMRPCHRERSCWI